MSTPEDDSLLSAINAKLQSLAGPEHLWPDWYHKWLKLAPDSTDVERVAASQAIWDSGELPEDAGFSLVVWQINEIADKLTDSRFKNLIDQMNVIENEFEQTHGRPWSDDEEPKEYTELLAKYDDESLKVFIPCLDSFGESGLADYYRRSPASFENRYDRGLQFFESDARQSATPPIDFVRVASFMTAPQADVARVALEQEGIQTAVDNANFVTAYWLRSNAVHGVVLSVPAKDEVIALRILDSMHEQPDHSTVSCRHCGQTMPASWDVCWKCGGNQSNNEDRIVDVAVADSIIAIENQHGVTEPPNKTYPMVFEGVVLVMLIGLFMYRPMVGAIAVPVAFVVLVLYRRSMNASDETSEDLSQRTTLSSEPGGMFDAVRSNPYKSPVEYDSSAEMGGRSDVLTLLLSLPIYVLSTLALLSILMFIFVGPYFGMPFASLAVLYLLYRRAMLNRLYGDDDDRETQ